jgi:hypothetical protein
VFGIIYVDQTERKSIMEEKLETNDQDQAGTPVEQTSEAQSETNTSEEENLFEMPDGKKVDAATLAKEWKENFYPEFTRRSQKLSDYEKKEQETEARAEEAAKAAVDKSSLLEGVDPNVKELIQQISLEGFKAYMSAEQEKVSKEQKDAEWQRRFDETIKKHDGSDGFPKAEKDPLIKYMIDKEIYDPEEAYHAITREKREDILIKKALMDKGVATSTESTGGDAPRKPSEKSPSNWEEATKSAYSRLPA